MFDETPIAEGQTVEGVVIKIDDVEKTAAVRMGNTQGVIDIADMSWARTPNPEIAFHENMIKRPGQALSVGDVVMVFVKQKLKDPDTQERIVVDVGPASAAELGMDQYTTSIDHVFDRGKVDMGYHYPFILTPNTCRIADVGYGLIERDGAVNINDLLVIAHK